jgi:hypothetical protein
MRKETAMDWIEKGRVVRGPGDVLWIISIVNGDDIILASMIGGNKSILSRKDLVRDYAPTKQKQVA